ncbi:putative 1-deoxy-D-xylulose-5-phosphate synthase [Helianthus annuus]|nr:putative 1-deoxy-D-xylulose-5-phosphate synthase [Helianthus annuus]
MYWLLFSTMISYILGMNYFNIYHFKYPAYLPITASFQKFQMFNENLISCYIIGRILYMNFCATHKVLITVEEGSNRGFSSHVAHYLAFIGLLDGNLKWRVMTLPDRCIEHGDQTYQIEEPG